MNDLKELENRYRKSGRLLDLARWVELLHQQGECAQVCEILGSEPIDLSHSPPSLQFVFARCLFDTGKLHEARVILGQLLEKAPDLGKGWELEYQIAMQLHEEQRIRECLERLDFLGWHPEHLRAAHPPSPVELDQKPKSQAPFDFTMPKPTPPSPSRSMGEDMASSAYRALSYWLLEELSPPSWDELMQLVAPLHSLIKQVTVSLSRDLGWSNLILLSEEE